MNGFIERESQLNVGDAVYDYVLPAGEGWMREVRPYQSLRIVDIEGNQAVDTVFFDTTDPNSHYSATATITAQKNIYLTTGSILRSASGKPLLEITADKTGRHDTLGGACSAQSNTVRYAHEKAHMHNCRDIYLKTLADSPWARLGKHDLVPNVNFFMNVPVTPEGGLEFVDGISAPGNYVELMALEHVMVLISNCPQMNNPCNAYNPTPVRILIWEAENV